jgi:hypothetical protein
MFTCSSDRARSVEERESTHTTEITMQIFRVLYNQVAKWQEWEGAVGTLEWWDSQSVRLEREHCCKSQGRYKQIESRHGFTTSRLRDFLTLTINSRHSEVARTTFKGFNNKKQKIRNSTSTPNLSNLIGRWVADFSRRYIRPINYSIVLYCRKFWTK